MGDRPDWRRARELPVSPDTVTVLGYRVTADCPAWRGLDLARAVLREQNTLDLAFLGELAPPDHHLDVPWGHPDDPPEAWKCCMYRVRPRRKGWRFARGEDGAWVLTKEAGDA